MCLEKELRNLENRCPSKWDEGLKRAFEAVGDGDKLEGICNENEKKEREEKLARGVKIKRARMALFKDYEIRDGV